MCNRQSVKSVTDMSSGTFAERQKCSLFHSPRGSFWLWEIQDLKPAARLLPSGRTAARRLLSAVRPHGRAALACLCYWRGPLPCGRAAFPSLGRAAVLAFCRAAVRHFCRAAVRQVLAFPSRRSIYVHKCTLPFIVTRGFNVMLYHRHGACPLHARAGVL